LYGIQNQGKHKQAGWHQNEVNERKLIVQNNKITRSFLPTIEKAVTKTCLRRNRQRQPLTQIYAWLLKNLDLLSTVDESNL
jgi:hypothetical protein